MADKSKSLDSEIYKKGEEVKKNVFALKYVRYAYNNPSDSQKYTHLRVVKKRGEEIHIVDMPLEGSDKTEHMRILVRGKSKRYNEMNEFYRLCKKKKNLPKLL